MNFGTLENEEIFFCRFVQKKLGGPSISEYEKLQAEKADLQLKYEELLSTHKETRRLVLSHIIIHHAILFLLAISSFVFYIVDPYLCIGLGSLTDVYG